jgi:hypothetical protein
MKLRVCFFLALLPALLVCASSQLSGQEVTAETKPTAAANPVSKPTRTPHQVVSNDPIVLLAMPSPATGAASSARVQDTETSGANETARKAAEIASVEQQIKDKQKRIVFLMRLFVEDERAFVNDPANMNVEPAVAERRRYEQDELHWETAELARLKARLRELTH